jgi:hypothetical protein
MDMQKILRDIALTLTLFPLRDGGAELSQAMPLTQEVFPLPQYSP